MPKLSNVVAVLVLAIAIVATVFLVQMNTPKHSNEPVPNESMILNAVRSVKFYTYNVTLSSYSPTKGNVTENLTGGFIDGIHYSRVVTGGKVMELVLVNGSLYVNESGEGFRHLNLSKKDMAKVFRDMDLATKLKVMMDNSTLVYIKRHGDGFIVRLDYNKSFEKRTVLGNVSAYIQANVTITLDSKYRPVKIETSETIITMGVEMETVKLHEVSTISYSKSPLPEWVKLALKGVNKGAD
ncbi:MAG: hypothetical protein GXO14_04385 [Thermococci archaeon]|nr:hypothetical protein [Thermococci archaeon]